MIALLPGGRRARGCSTRQAAAVLLLPVVVSQILLCAAAAPTTKAAAKEPVVLGVREQCGGLLWSGSLRSGSPMDAPYPQVQCAKGLMCHRDSKWYYECVPEKGSHEAWKLEHVLQGSASTKAMVDVMAAVDQPQVEPKADGKVVTQQTAARVASSAKADLFDAMDQHEKVHQHPVLSQYLRSVPQALRSVFTKHAVGSKPAESEAEAEAKEILTGLQDGRPKSALQTQATVQRRKVLSSGSTVASSKPAVTHLEEHERELAATLVGYYQRRLKGAPLTGEGSARGPDDNAGATKSKVPVFTTDTTANSDRWSALGITNKQYSQYSQCGGLQPHNAQGNVTPKDAVWDGAECWPGWQCNRVNEFYWQCQPKPEYQRPEATVTGSDGQTKKVLNVWAQCGGKGGQVPDGVTPVDGPYPDRVCFPTTDCVRQNEWYWQCLPGTGFTPGGSPNPNASPVPFPSPSPVSPSPSPLASPDFPSPPVYPSPPAYPSPPVYASPSPYLSPQGYYSPSPAAGNIATYPPAPEPTPSGKRRKLFEEELDYE